MTSNTIVVDTNIIVSLLNQRDATHKVVSKLLKKIEEEHATFFLNSLILAEICTVLLLRSKSVQLAADARKLLTTPGGNFSIVPFAEALEKQTYQVFALQTKPRLSVADCSLIAQAKLLNITHIFTLDKQLQKVLRSYELEMVKM